MRHSRTACYIGIGSNLGAASMNVQRALEQLTQLPGTELIAQSSQFRTAPVDAAGDDYINVVARIDTALSAEELLKRLQAIENEAGRLRPYRNAPRTLDLDLLLYGQTCIDSATLQVPHPRMTERAFVLIPLLQLDPLITIPGHGPAHNFVQAVAGQTIQKI